MDVMTAFPRSLFSESEMEVTRWFASRLGASCVPSVRQVKDHRHEVLTVAGASPTLREGKLGHVYSMLDLATLLKHVSVISTPIIACLLTFQLRNSPTPIYDPISRLMPKTRRDTWSRHIKLVAGSSRLMLILRVQWFGRPTDRIIMFMNPLSQLSLTTSSLFSPCDGSNEMENIGQRPIS